MNKQLFNDNWQFARTDLNGKLGDVTSWQNVDVPHDWLIYDTKNLYLAGIGWYKKSFEISDLNANDYYAIRFDGVYQDTTVFINNSPAFEWKNGYTTFEFDATPFLTNGVNEIIVRVNYESPNSRWYSGAGIYRNVWLKQGSKDHFISDGIYITPVKIENDIWNVEIDSQLMVCTKDDYKVIHTILSAAGDIVATGEDTSMNNDTNSQTLQVKNPLLWDVGQGNLYTVRSELVKDAQVVDVDENRFGFREVEMSPDGGFVINGRRIKLFGVCQHHDLGALGAAFNKVAQKRQFELLLKMGMNAVRTAHNVPATEFMELADEMGIIVCSEILDMWKNKKTTYDYARFFDEWIERDMASWIRRDRNCPSVVMWSIGNEVSDTHVDESGIQTTKMLMDLVKLHDPKGHAPATFGSNYLPWENTQKCGDVIKLVGYNYAEKYYEDHHTKYPDWTIYGSETASTVQSRGVYKFPLAQSLMADDDEQCSSLGNSSTSWGARSTEGCIIADRDATFSLGQFIWTGTDYIGEPTPYHTKNSYLGQIDTAGFFKDTAYIYQGAWTDFKTTPFVHIFPYWDFSPGQLIDVRVATNLPKVELFLNDSSLGMTEIDHQHGAQLVANYQIRYTVGVLTAKGYNEDNEIVATQTIHSFTDAKILTLSTEQNQVLANGEDLIFVEINTEDANGNYVANANNRVNVQVSGAGRLIGLDNGDATDYDSYKGTSRRLFNGKLLAIVAPNFEAGDIQINAESIGLEPATIKIQSLPTKIPLGVNRTLVENSKSPKNNEIPIRKIELTPQKSNELNSECFETTVTAKIFPENATYDDLTWRVTNAAGIDSTIATVEIIDDKTVKVVAHGDGVFYLRCMTNNGAAKPRLISQLDFTATHLGDAYLNPYDFISGGLYTRSNIDLTNGNDRGVATDRELESHVIFDKINFGEIGSDTITLPLFPLLHNTFPIEIWEGIPNEGELIDTVYYDLGSTWNTYKEKTYKLPRKIKGLTTLSFVLKQKVHIKGFSFTAPQKAFEQLFAKDFNFISGDTFQVHDDIVANIGNNVTLIYNDMDFSQHRPTKLEICGTTPLDINTIQIRISDGEKESVQVVEFRKSAEFEVQTFDIEPVDINGQVSFIFLPGCNFDFKWFKFIK